MFIVLYVQTQKKIDKYREREETVEDTLERERQVVIGHVGASRLW